MVFQFFQDMCTSFTSVRICCQDLDTRCSNQWMLESVDDRKGIQARPGGGGEGTAAEDSAQRGRAAGRAGHCQRPRTRPSRQPSSQAAVCCLCLQTTAWVSHGLGNSVTDPHCALIGMHFLSFSFLRLFPAAAGNGPTGPGVASCTAGVAVSAARLTRCPPYAAGNASQPSQGCAHSYTCERCDHY